MRWNPTIVAGDAGGSPGGGLRQSRPELGRERGHVHAGPLTRFRATPSEAHASPPAP